MDRPAPVDSAFSLARRLSASARAEPRPPAPCPVSRRRRPAPTSLMPFAERRPRPTVAHASSSPARSFGTFGPGAAADVLQLAAAVNTTVGDAGRPHGGRPKRPRPPDGSVGADRAQRQRLSRDGRDRARDRGDRRLGGPLRLSPLASAGSTLSGPATVPVATPAVGSLPSPRPPPRSRPRPDAVPTTTPVTTHDPAAPVPAGPAAPAPLQLRGRLPRRPAVTRSSWTRTGPVVGAARRRAPPGRVTVTSPGRTKTWSIWLCGRRAGQVRPVTPRRHRVAEQRDDRGPPEVAVAGDDGRRAGRRQRARPGGAAG